MDITYKNRKIEKVCTDVKTAERTYGREIAEKIHQRIDEITAADTVEMMVQFHIGRCHPLHKIGKANMRWIWFILTDWYLRRMGMESK